MSFPALDAELVSAALAAPPFVTVEGVFNIRDFGGYTTAAGARIRPLHLFRSGEPSRITAAGTAQLRALGITTVFDLRAAQEIAKYRSANAAIEGVEFVQAPMLEETMDPVGIAERLKDFAKDEAEAFLTLYTHILQTAGKALEVVLIHLRDRPGEPCLLHCTAGKDRSGIFAAVILMLLGANDEDIVNDYALTTIGLQPVLPLLALRFQKESPFRDNWEGTLNMVTARPQTMHATLGVIRDKFGGIEEYLRIHTALTHGDFARIRTNLLVS